MGFMILVPPRGTNTYIFTRYQAGIYTFFRGEERSGRWGRWFKSSHPDQ